MQVKVLGKEGVSALVEWEENGDLQRVYIPVTAIKSGNTVHKSTLEAGIPYGLDWVEAIGEMRATPAEIARRLHAAGIWTAQDLFKNGNAALGAVQAAYGLDLAALMTAAQKHQRGGK